MTRWTSTPQEDKHISEISLQVPVAGIGEIMLSNGRIVEGVIREMQNGNNAGEGGRWQYYGEVTIETKTRERISIDYLDIKSARSAWTEQKGEEYEGLGLIQVRKLQP